MIKKLIVAKCFLFIAMASSVKADPAIDFEQWKLTLKPKMMAQINNQVLVEQIIHSLQYLPRVVELDKKQPEGRLTHEEYLTQVIPEWKVEKAREAFKTHRFLLKQAENRTGVKAKFIVALWGKESNFGSVTGNYHVPSALATLAFDGRRAKFFTKELMAATKIISDGHIELDKMKGSWAGAMGNCQFMPSTFLQYAVDANGDGKKDIWGDKQDIFASMGNFLKKLGWQSEQTWGRQVKLLQPFHQYPMGKSSSQTLAQWQTAGIRRSDMRDLPEVDIKAYLIAPGGEKGRIYLVYHNFDVIMRWNRSHYFATGVGYLADRVGYPKIN